MKNTCDDSESQSGSITPRQALIYAALAGWRGDEPNPWFCPVAIDDLLAWAASYRPHPIDSLSQVLDELVLEGLFFEVHRGLFSPPCYYCSYAVKFLRDIPDGLEHVEYWQGLMDRYDEEHGPDIWRRLGLCAGQGSQGPSDAPWGPCRGTACCWFVNGNERCNHSLRFAKGLKVSCVGCGQETVREELRKFASGIWLKDSEYATYPVVCGKCVNSPKALARLIEQHSDTDKERTVQEFRRRWSGSEQGR
jgi:hypothetical protein